jgi:hypothetical protein
MKKIAFGLATMLIALFTASCNNDGDSGYNNNNNNGMQQEDTFSGSEGYNPSGYNSQYGEGNVGGQSNSPGSENRQGENVNNGKVPNTEPAGGLSGTINSQDNGLNPDTTAPGTRIGNTYKSGNPNGQYMKVIKPGTDTGTKVKQQHLPH